MQATNAIVVVWQVQFHLSAENEPVFRSSRVCVFSVFSFSHSPWLSKMRAFTKASVSDSFTSATQQAASQTGLASVCVPGKARIRSELRPALRTRCTHVLLRPVSDGVLSSYCLPDFMSHPWCSHFGGITSGAVTTSEGLGVSPLGLPRLLRVLPLGVALLGAWGSPLWGSPLSVRVLGLPFGGLLSEGLGSPLWGSGGLPCEGLGVSPLGV